MIIQKIYSFIHRNAKKSKAQATLELMLVMPILTFFMFFAFDYSRVIIAKWTVMNMARAGVRMAVMQGAQNNPNSNTKLKDIPQNQHGRIQELCPQWGNDCIAAAAAIIAMAEQFKSNHKREFEKPLYYNFDPKKHVKIVTPHKKDLGRQIKTENNGVSDDFLLAVEVCMDARIQMPFTSNGKTMWGNVSNGYMTVCHSYASAHSQIDQKS